VKAPKKVDRRRIKIDVEELIILRYKVGMSLRKLAEHFGCSKSTITDRLQSVRNLLLTDDESATLDKLFADSIRRAKMRILMQMASPEASKGIKQNHLAFSLNAVDRIDRLNRGEATDRSIVETVAQKEARMSDIEREIETLLGEIKEGGEGENQSDGEGRSISTSPKQKKP
jgi:DNA invertase Pin-like site-specific DNA recombinase